MVKFLVARPIAVSMTFLAFIIMGSFAMTRLPVSLMPDVAIPEMTVKIDGKDMPVRQLQNGVVRPLRRQLMQTPHLKSLKSEARDESAVFHLEFEYGTNVDLAFIDVNEKIDRAMNFLPDDLPRPRVIKARASDIPVFYLNITAKEAYLNAQSSKTREVSSRFVELSNFAERVIRKRLEQLPEVAIADVSGTVNTEIAIIPDKQKLRSLNMHYSDIETAIHANNLKLGTIVVKDGIYQYNLRFDKTLNSKEDIEKITLKAGNKTLELQEIANVKVRPAKRSGLVTSQGQEAVSLAVIKKSGARMEDMQQSLNTLIKNFHAKYPNLQFQVIRDQTKLLDYSIHNLGNTLLLGAILAFVIMFLFLRDIRTPLLIGISIPASLIISILLFHVFGISVNIISLSGLVLGLGMMIDNSIIVIDNITQYIDRGHSLVDACIQATNEVIRPLLSSVLTTCAVFIPLIFISGLAGALFYDQAMAVAIGLFISFFVSITLVPVYYKLVFRKDREKRIWLGKQVKGWNYYSSYEKGLNNVLRHRSVMTGIFLLIVVGGLFFYRAIDKEKIPQIKHNEMFVSLQWNDKINVAENKRRSLMLLKQIDTLIEQTSVYAGSQQYLMNLNNINAPNASKIYIKFQDSKSVKVARQNIRTFFRKNYPEAHFDFLPPENVFELLFSEDKPPLVARIMPYEKEQGLDYSQVNALLHQTDNRFDAFNFSAVPAREHIEIALDAERLKIYDIKREQVINKLRTLFNEYQVSDIKNSRHFMPIVLAHSQEPMFNLINQAKIKNENKQYIPLKEVLAIRYSKDFKTITSGENGEYYPLVFHVEKEKVSDVQRKIENFLARKAYDVTWHGSIFSTQQMVEEILIILLISLLLLYFILASQFESLSLPFIVLLEVPMDIAGALFLLWLMGETLNIMSLIGIIVMAGIIINDSILKIDTINRLRYKGYTLTESLFIGGKRRLKPILMTSLTTIMAMLPFLFISGMGSDLQRPLAVAVIGGMAIGTFVSLYFIPLFYYLLKRPTQKSLH
ncbi:MAG: efflux RND transporter permease subunit [Bacteroidales bacterium]|nr:efflux RND transporter permease subunit [Bacteroidales bacterium]MCF8337074.1 efflux RND transporter permease subunit [Bacteroidales bacterium]